MSDMIDDFKALKALRKAERAVFGRPCPDCIVKRPKAQPKILLPNEICRAHKPHFRDPRGDASAEEYNRAMAGTGWSRLATNLPNEEEKEVGNG